MDDLSYFHDNLCANDFDKLSVRLQMTAPPRSSSFVIALIEFISSFSCSVYLCDYFSLSFSSIVMK